MKVTELEPGNAIEREVMLVRINTEPKRRGEILDAARAFDAKPVDVGGTTITFEVSGLPDHLADFLELMRSYGIVALAKSGRIAMAKDDKTTSRKPRLQTA